MQVREGGHPLRRSVLAGLAAIASAPATSAPAATGTVETACRTWESQSGGQVGFVALDTGTGRSVSHRATARFAFASTFKWALAAAILERVDRGDLKLDQIVPVRPDDMVPYAPVTEKHVQAGGAPLETLCAGIVELSDNPGANLLMRLIGGPPGLTTFVRRHGDRVTRFDRWETDLNENAPGDPRDTTSPRAMVGLMQRLLLGTALSPTSRARLIGWMETSPTGRDRLRAGLPSGWRAADKTGTGARGAVNDVALVYPPGRAPLLMAVYMRTDKPDLTRQKALHADLARLAVQTLVGPKAG